MAFVKLFGASRDVRALIDDAQQQTEPGTYTSFEACIATWKLRLPQLVSSHCCPRGLSNFSWLQLLSARVGTCALRQRDEDEEAWYSRARIALMLLYALQYVFHRMHRLGSTIAAASPLTLEHSHYPVQQQQQHRRDKRAEEVDASLVARKKLRTSASTSEYTTVVPCYVCVCVLEAIEQLMESAAAKRDDDVMAAAVEMLAEGESVDMVGPSRLCVGSVCTHRTRSSGKKSSALSADWIPASEVSTSIAFGPDVRLRQGRGAAPDTPTSMTRAVAPLSARERQLLSSLCTKLVGVEAYTAPLDVEGHRNEYRRLKRKKINASGKISGISLDHRTGDGMHSEIARTPFETPALQAVTESNAAANANDGGGDAGATAKTRVDVEVQHVKGLVEKSLAQLTGAEEKGDVHVRGTKQRQPEALSLLKMEDAIRSSHPLVIIDILHDNAACTNGCPGDTEDEEEDDDTSDDEDDADDGAQRMPSIVGLTPVQF